MCIFFKKSTKKTGNFYFDVYLFIYCIQSGNFEIPLIIHRPKLFVTTKYSTKYI